MNLNSDAILDHLHDMKSPLAAMLLCLDLLEQKKIGTLNKKQEEIVTSMRQSVEKMKKALATFPQD